MDELPDFEKVLNVLKHMKEADARVERAVILLLGFRREVHRKVVRGKDVKRIMWVPPFGGEPIPEPRCTTSIDDAYRLARMFLHNDHKFGAAWEPGLASAKIDGGLYWEAKLPQAAVCIALLHHVVPMRPPTVQ